ncbi:MAG: AAA family ATPase [Acidobacteria bacterium]|nr:AAA family ATPase [Acidobacteriota bacterium]
MDAHPTATADSRNPESLRTAILRGLSHLQAVLVGKDLQVRRAMAAMLSGGHLLIEDLPGVGKTTLARGLARILGGRFQRVQGTNDLLPSDLLGVHLWEAASQSFRFQPGPVFCNVLLLDELNRIGPKTQSAMLEVMVEGQVTLDRNTHPLPDPFYLIATQNPMDHSGTFPLPESQLDRFACVLHLGYPESAPEARVLRGEAGMDRLQQLEPTLDMDGWRLARAQVRKVGLSEPILDYVERVASRIRTEGAFCSTRALRQWIGLAQAEAWLEGRAFLVPDDLQATLGDAMAHRGTLDERRLNRGERRERLGRVLAEIPVGWKP